MNVMLTIVFFIVSTILALFGLCGFFILLDYRSFAKQLLVGLSSFLTVLFAILGILDRVLHFLELSWWLVLLSLLFYIVSSFLMTTLSEVEEGDSNDSTDGGLMSSHDTGESLTELVLKLGKREEERFTSQVGGLHSSSFWSRAENCAETMISSNPISILSIWRVIVARLIADGSLAGVSELDRNLLKAGCPEESTQFLRDLSRIVRSRSMPDDLIVVYRERGMQNIAGSS